MIPSSPAPRFPAVRSLLAFMLLCSATGAPGQSPAEHQHHMSFTDVLGMRAVRQPAVSPDGQWLVCSLSAPDWQDNKRYSDIYLVSMKEGLPTSRQMTFTAKAGESSPAWSRDSRAIAFLSDRESDGLKKGTNQLYFMRIDGGEARQLTREKEGVTHFAFSRDGQWLAYSAGKEDDRHLHVLSVHDLDSTKSRRIFRHAVPVLWWAFTPDSKSILLLAPDSVNQADKERKKKGFSVTIRNEEAPPVRLWSVHPAGDEETLLTKGSEYSVNGVTVSEDGHWIGFRGIPNNRYVRNTTEQNIYGDVYLLEAASGRIERLTENGDVYESTLRFSPSGTWMAFAAADSFQYFRNSKIRVRRVKARRETWKVLGEGFDEDLSVEFWSADEREIFFNCGLGVTEQICAADVNSGRVRQITDVKGTISLTRDDDSKSCLLRYSDPQHPDDLYTLPSPGRAADRSHWVRLTDANPQCRDIALGAIEVIRWPSTDGTMVEGILVRPVGFEVGKRYPLVVQIHGGPAGAVTLRFNASYSYYSHVYAGAGYACFLPNYRGSTNYGEHFKDQIAGDYFRQGYDDVMSGVDFLIASGIADSTKMGVMGWSAGGHWSNWILTHTNRFKAISSGAGGMNWISMYAQTDVQRIREFYFGGRPYGRFDAYWDVSPLKYITNASTPTMVHVVEGDPRVPRPQSEELYMALKKLGVPTEFLVYPGKTHGIGDLRNQLTKMSAEFGWMEKWIRGKTDWLDWPSMLSTLKSGDASAKSAAGESPLQEPDREYPQ